MKPRKTNRLLALGLCLCLLLTMLPLSGFAAETGCKHVHDAYCGYIKAVEGRPCTFHHTPHDDSCGYAEAQAASPCSVEAAHTVHDAECGGDPETGEGCHFKHEHDDACGYAEEAPASPCSVEAAHVHDAYCGYVETVADAPCTHAHDASCGGLHSRVQNGLPAPPQGRANTIPEMDPKAVGFAGKEWWVIGKDGTGVNSTDGTMTLLSKENLFTTEFDTNDSRGGEANNQYGGSLLQKEMENYYDSLSAENKALIVARAQLDDVRVDDYYEAILPGSHCVWPLSKAEAECLPDDILANGFNWWLRSVFASDYAGLIFYNGSISADDVDSVGGGRPALTLKLDDVLFTSAAGNDKSGAAAGSQGLIPLSAADTVKLTVADDANLALHVTSTGPITAKAGETVSFAYTDAKTGPGRSVSVLIKDQTNGNILYGRPVDCKSGNGSGTASFQLPDSLAAGDYILLAFNEQVNGANETDFASTPVSMELKVESGGSPSVPGVANGETVYFAGNEWFVIGLNGTGVHSADGTMTLLSKGNLFTTAFDNYANRGDARINKYDDSVLQKAMENYYTSLSAENKALIVARELDGVRVDDHYDATLPGNHFVWPLSRAEANSLPQDTVLKNGDVWWLRSAYNGTNHDLYANAVDDIGHIIAYAVYGDWGFRPALTLKLDNASLVTVSAGEHGSISPSGKVVVPKNGRQTFTITADEGYVLSDFKVGGVRVEAGSSYTLNKPSEDCAIEASFTAATPPTAKYDPRDVAVINDMIDNNGLKWTRDDPDSWPTNILVWDDNTPRRIQHLDIHDADLYGELDVSRLSNLRSLECSDNSLTGLNVAGLSSLTNLYCRNAGLTGKLNLTGLNSLCFLDCSDNSLSGLDLTGLNDLMLLGCSNIGLTGTLDLSNLRSLESLYCSDNSLTSLDVSSLSNLNLLFCSDNPIQSLKLPGGEVLTVTVSPKNSGTVMLTHSGDLLSRGGKTVTLTATPGYGYTFTGWTGDGTPNGDTNSLPLSGVMNVTANFNANPTVEYDPGDVAVVNGIIKGNRLGWEEDKPDDWPKAYGSGPYLTWDSNSTHKRITGLYLSGSGLTGTLDVTGLSSLQTLDCQSNSLEGLEVAGLSELQTLNCFNNSLNNLDVTDLTSLEKLYCSNSGLKKLEVTDLPMLQTLDCGYNSLNSQDALKLANLPSLELLYCSDSGLPNLDVSSLTNLQTLDCSGNSLDELSLLGLPNLQILNCFKNSLGALDLSSQAGLISLDCSGNSLTSLDLSDLSNPQYLFCSGNPIRSLKLPERYGGELTVDVTPANSGKVMLSHDGNIFLTNKKVTLTATAEAGYKFSNWTGSKDGSKAAISFNIIKFMTVTANFIKDPSLTYSLTVQAGAGGRITQGTSGNYKAGAPIALEAKADAGYAFDGWISLNGGSFASADSASTFFIMPDNATTVIAKFRRTGGGFDPGPGLSYTQRTLTGPFGVRVSGLFTSDAALEVKERLPHPVGTCEACDDIRRRQENGELIVAYDISLKSGGYSGDVTVELPVGEAYNGQTVILIHCKNKVMDSRTLTVSGGYARGTFTSLSPFAAAKVPAGAAITGLPESYALLVGKTVRWTPKPAGGSWSYDQDLLKLTKDGDTYTFQALKTGKATATYTVNGVPFTVTITVNSSTIPQTGDTASTLPWALLMPAALGGIGGLLVCCKFGRRKRHG